MPVRLSPRFPAGANWERATPRRTGRDHARWAAAYRTPEAFPISGDFTSPNQVDLAGVDQVRNHGSLASRYRLPRLASATVLTPLLIPTQIRPPELFCGACERVVFTKHAEVDLSDYVAPAAKQCAPATGILVHQAADPFACELL
jgi:hypothetical protein